MRGMSFESLASDITACRLCAAQFAATKSLLDRLPEFELTVLVGGHATAWHLGGEVSVTARVAGWRDHAPALFPLPHPSWRNTACLKRNPWFAADCLPVVRARVREVLTR